MRYSIEPKDRVYVKGYGFSSFAKNMGTHLSNEYGQKLLDTAKKSTTDAIKTAEATGDLIGNKISDKITSRASPKDVNASKKSNKELAKEETEDIEMTTHEKAYISPKERQQIINELRLVPKNYWWTKVSTKNDAYF